jgi:hypothetical protein
MFGDFEKRVFSLFHFFEKHDFSLFHFFLKSQKVKKLKNTVPSVKNVDFALKNRRFFEKPKNSS